VALLHFPVLFFYFLRSDVTGAAHVRKKKRKKKEKKKKKGRFRRQLLRSFLLSAAASAFSHLLTKEGRGGAKRAGRLLCLFSSSSPARERERKGEKRGERGKKKDTPTRPPPSLPACFL